MSSASPIKAFITDPHLRGGGQVRYVLSLVKRLQEEGACTFALGCKPGSMLEEEGRALGCRIVPLALRGGLRPHVWIRDLAAVRRVFKEFQPDIVHVNGSQDHWICALAGILNGRPARLVRTRHNTFPVRNTLPNRVLNRRWTDAHIAVCESVRRELAEHPAFHGRPLRAIHNGVDPDAFQPMPEVRASVREEFGFTDEHVVVGIVGRLVADKGHAVLFCAMEELCRNLPGVRLLVLGEGPLDGMLHALADELGMANKARFAGFRHDMARCVQAIDVGVQPSIACDTSSFSAKEIMAAGKPVVVSNHGGLPEIVRDGVEGFVVPAGDAETLGRRLAELAGAPELRQTMGQAARERVRNEFSEAVFAERTLHAYRDALGLT